MASSTIIATATVIASNTVLATATQQIKQVPEWFSYIVDIALAIIFLAILLFTKPEENKTEELTPEEMPNELEKVLRTDSDDPPTNIPDSN